ncbi:MAG TPA: helix-turn-helix domain-containing protein [Mycobacteriales bacterium]|nr:helix-turn-helix domain-containing protein [Mycobacteriales bacterium]
MSDLSPVVQAFLDEHIFSASQLEVLLLLRDDAGRAWPLAEVSRRTALPQSSLGPWLDSFVSRGLLTREGDTYRFAPAEPRMEEVVAEVADVYKRRRTTVSRHIYARTQDPLVRFADAFRLRRPGSKD